MSNTQASQDENTLRDIEAVQAKHAEKLGIEMVTPKQAINVAKTNLLIGKATFFVGLAGVGKTRLHQQLIAELSHASNEKWMRQYCNRIGVDFDKLTEAEKSWGLNIFHLQHIEKEDLAGYPFPPNGTEAHEARILMRPGLPHPIKNKRFGIFFMDEANRCDRPVISPAFTLMEDRRIGPYQFPDTWGITLAGNPSSAQYMVNDMEQDPAIRRRICMVFVKCSVSAWLEYAEGNKFHPAVTDYIRTQGSEALYDIEAQEQGRAAATPATWEDISKYLYSFEAQGTGLKEMSPVPSYIGAALSGCIGRVRASEFIRHVKNVSEIIDPNDVMINFRRTNPVYAKVENLAQVVGELVALANKVAEMVAINKPAPAEVAGSIAEFSKFLAFKHPEVFQSFKERLYSALDQTDEDTTTKPYKRAFTDALMDQPEWKETRTMVIQKTLAVTSGIQKST